MCDKFFQLIDLINKINLFKLFVDGKTKIKM